MSACLVCLQPGSEALVFLAEVLFEGLTIPGGEAGEGGLSIAADKRKAARLWKVMRAVRHGVSSGRQVMGPAAESAGLCYAQAVGYEGDSEARYHYALCLLHGHGAPGDG